MSESTEPYKVQGSRVYGQGYSYNLTSKIDAEQLHKTLTNYEKEITNLQLQQNTSEQFDRITKQVIQIQLTLGILDNDIKKLKKVVENVNNH